MEREHKQWDASERIATTVRVGVLCWAGAILTTSYLNLGKPSADLTFPASVFSAALASFGIERTNGNGNGNGKKNCKPGVTTSLKEKSDSVGIK
tara:strand:+ start:9753 stop:10034 length:282 start_codon:yes stop_codon:yes gene_type:complete